MTEPDILAQIDAAMTQRARMLDTPVDLRPANWKRQYDELHARVESLWSDIRRSRAGQNPAGVPVRTVDRIEPSWMAMLNTGRKPAA
jgi:hypothetical protein